MPTRDETFYSSIRDASDPFAEVQKFIAQQPAEDEALEFKGGRMDENAIKKCWSRAVSGFANTGGGILIFGIRAGSQKDQATGKTRPYVVAEEFADVKQYETSLKGVQLHVTTDLVQGIEILPIAREDGKGFVVCLIPEGKHKPYRALLDPTENYFQRVGDNFVLLPHSLLRSLFYPRFVPKLKMGAKITTKGSEKLIALVLQNEGVATASEMVMEVRASLPVICRSTPEEVLQFEPREVVKPAKIAVTYLTAKHSLHPGGTTPLATFAVATQNLGFPSFQLWFSVYMQNQEPAFFAHTFTLQNDFGWEGIEVEIEQAAKGTT